MLISIEVTQLLVFVWFVLFLCIPTELNPFLVAFSVFVLLSL